MCGDIQKFVDNLNETLGVKQKIDLSDTALRADFVTAITDAVNGIYSMLYPSELEIYCNIGGCPDEDEEVALIIERHSSSPPLLQITWSAGFTEKVVTGCGDMPFRDPRIGMVESILNFSTKTIEFRKVPPEKNEGFYPQEYGI